MLVGLCGYAGVGKDAIAERLPFFQRRAFATALKEDLAPVVAQFGLDLANREHKSLARDLLVAYGKLARAVVHDFWITRLEPTLPVGDCVITDVRYQNEVRMIRAKGGTIIRVFRAGCEPANDEERRSFARIDAIWPDLPRVFNDTDVKSAVNEVLQILAR